METPGGLTFQPRGAGMLVAGDDNLVVWGERQR